MTEDDFRRLALEFPGVVEAAHRGHPDFRRDGKIFATLRYPDENWGMVKLTPEQQDNFVRAQVGVFVPVKGAWGRQGCTSVRLAAAEEKTVQSALRIAWERSALQAARKPRKKVSTKTR